LFFLGSWNPAVIRFATCAAITKITIAVDSSAPSFGVHGMVSFFRPPRSQTIPTIPWSGLKSWALDGFSPPRILCGDIFNKNLFFIYFVL
jgi:hypothetical protein